MRKGPYWDYDKQNIFVVFLLKRYSITVNQIMVATSEGRLRTNLYDKRDDFNFPIVNFPFICSYIPAAPAYGVYLSQMIRYSRACGSYQDFLDRGVAANKKAIEPRVPFGKVEVITSKSLRSPP
jgi:hypothetical protein